MDFIFSRVAFVRKIIHYKIYMSKIMNNFFRLQAIPCRLKIPATRST